jgi:hypothetical protein
VAEEDQWRGTATVWKINGVFRDMKLMVFGSATKPAKNMGGNGEDGCCFWVCKNLEGWRETEGVNRLNTLSHVFFFFLVTYYLFIYF